MGDGQLSNRRRSGATRARPNALRPLTRAVQLPIRKPMVAKIGLFGVVAAALLAAALAVFAAPARSATAWDCKRVITPAEWHSVLGVTATVKYGESPVDCAWFHGRRRGPQGLISGYPAVYKIWHQIYVQDRTRTRPYAECELYEYERARVRSFG